MILAIDVGNTSTTVGLFDPTGALRFRSSFTTQKRATRDQCAISLLDVFRLYGEDMRGVTGAILSSVVPPVTAAMRDAVELLTGQPPMVMGPGVRTGLNIKSDIHAQMGADIVAASVAAIAKYPTPLILIDMGTAIAMSVIRGSTYEGCVIMPGVTVALEALSDRAAELPHISVEPPACILGHNTVDAMRAGAVYGNAGMIDGMIQRLEAASAPAATVVGTGNNAPDILQKKHHLRCRSVVKRALSDLSEKHRGKAAEGIRPTIVFTGRYGRGQIKCVASSEQERQQEVISMDHSKTRRLTELALFTAIVVVLQVISTLVKFGPFSITLTLVPIVVGAAIYGPKTGAYLGGVFGLVATVASITGMDPGGALYWNAQPFFTVLVIMAKGILAGLIAGLIYQVLKKHQTAAAVVAAILCPVVNTGIFLLGTFTLFYDLLLTMAGGTNVIVFALTGLLGWNFIVEFLVSLVLGPVIVRIVNAHGDLNLRRS